MLIVPAIDIRDGKCVRLVQGDYDRETVFGNRPAEMARRWVEAGGRALHLVDLDGAKSGNPDNYAAVEAILSELAVVRTELDLAEPVVTDLGGGIRDLETVDRWLGAGLDRVILGTAAVRNPELVSQAASKQPGKIWVGIDARAGKVAVAGWTEATDVDAIELARDVESRGAAGIVYTDIDRDGTGEGVNAEATAAVAGAVGIPVYASGGVHSVDDVLRLRRVADAGIAGVVVGRALYDGTVTLAELIEAAA